MNEIAPLPTAQPRLIVTDPEELSKGLAIADRGGLKHLAYLKFFSKNPQLQQAVAALVQARIENAPLDSVPGDLKRALSRALARAK